MFDILTHTGVLKKRTKNSISGITLVALVITIVVLLILVGITLVYAFGDNGVFQKAQEAKNKTEEAIKNEQEDYGKIGNKINEYANGTGNSETNPDNPKPESPKIIESTSLSHTATTINYTWDQMSKVAQAIANSKSVDSLTMEVKANIDGTECTIGVGDIATVKYKESETSEVERRVRILGFKHDILVKKYDGTENTDNSARAGISFEFLDFMTGSTLTAMHSSATNEGGWANMQLRRELNGYDTNEEAQSGLIGGLGTNLNNKEYIKQVKKQYVKKHDDASYNNNYTNDYLWLLACSEIFSEGYTLGAYANAITSEGNQYQYYKKQSPKWDTNNTCLEKKSSELGNREDWWLRSPAYRLDSAFCLCQKLGKGNVITGATKQLALAPCFCI